MTRSLRIGSVALTCVIVASAATAQTLSTGIDQLIKNGQKVAIVDEEGRELVGRVDGLSADSLGLKTRQSRFDIRFDDIVRIDHPHDGLGNGALIGAGVVVGLAVTSLVVGNRCEGFAERCPSMPAWVPFWAIGTSAAVGAGLGVAIDAMIHRDPAIYRRRPGARTSIAPTVGRGTGGAVVSFTW